MTWALAVMARFPEAGMVKTRLAQVLGDEAALALYRAFLADISKRFAYGEQQLVWLYEPPTSDFAAQVADGTFVVPQRGASLAERMQNAFVDLLGSGRYTGVTMIGADVPHVREEWLAEAQRLLETEDLVLGPSDDGGYYLIAMRQTYDLFSGIEMSTATVLQRTLERAADLGCRVGLLPRWFDLDEVDDLSRLAGILAVDPELSLPATERELAIRLPRR